MGVGTIEKTPVVIDDAIAIRSICLLSLSFDHRPDRRRPGPTSSLSQSEAGARPGPKNAVSPEMR